MKIYKISTLSLPYGFSYGDTLISSISDYEAIIYHSSFNSAYNELKRFYNEIESEYKKDYLRFYIEEIVVDKKDYWNVHFYDQNLNLIFNYNHKNMGKRFLGKKPEDCLYKVGQWVEFIKNDTLYPGLIAALPLSPEYISSKKITNADEYDNSYLILHSSPYPSDTNPHDHTMEPHIIGPLSHKISTRDKILIEERFKKNK